MTSDVIAHAKALIACPSVTPEDAGAQAYLRSVLTQAGFTCFSLPFGEGPERVENLFARIGTGAPHICYAGHTDVVPPGPENQWTHGPFDPVIENGVLYGRGASDMKGSVAAFTAAALEFIKAEPSFKGSISLLITGDEEGPAISGTVKVLEWMGENGHIPDFFLVGEPTNPDHLGQEIKIGRRGSLSGILRVEGKQGHVAYPQRAANPLPALVLLLDALAGHRFDTGSEFFQPTNLEITSIDVGNKAGNVIPAAGTAQFNIRFNDQWSADTLEAELRRILDGVKLEDGCLYTLEVTCGAQSFITQPGPWTQTVSRAVQEITGRTPALTTSGGTSDARFAALYGPVVEFGGVNATIHQIDENAAVQDLEDLVRIYRRIIALAQGL